jgi:hypothetical protein
MGRKIREFGEFPLEKKEGDWYNCEICTESGRLLYGIYKLMQGPECGRWVCLNCWDEENATCKLCSKHMPGSTGLDEYYSSKVRELHELEEKLESRRAQLEKIQNDIKNLNEKLSSIKFCPFCNAPMPKTARYCGICGKEL